MSSYSNPPFSPFDPTTPNVEPETPELEHLLEYAVTKALHRANVCMPAKVQAVSGNQKVDIQLLTQTLYADEFAPQDRPILTGVPVAMPHGATWSIKFPLAVGDTGLALFADRSLDAYLAGDGSATYDPADTRAHDIADAIFLPGLPTYSTQTTDQTTDMVLTNGSTQVHVRADGKVQLKNDTHELVSLVNDLLTQLLALMNVLQTQTFTATMLGPQPFIASTVAALNNVTTQLNTAQTNLATLLAT